MKIYIICNGYYPFLAYQGKVSHDKLQRFWVHFISWNLPKFICKKHYQTNEVVGKGRKQK
jgi:hypothetical protein